jgi:hypothetical protein
MIQAFIQTWYCISNEFGGEDARANYQTNTQINKTTYGDSWNALICINIMILGNTYTMSNIEVTVILYAYLKNTGEDVNSKHLKLYYSIRAYYVTCHKWRETKKSSAKFKHGKKKLNARSKKNIKFTPRLHL